MEKFTPASLHAIDDSFINEKSKRVGTLNISEGKSIGGSKWIAQVMPYGSSNGDFPDYDEAKKYAHLFAAAPDLLEAAKYAIECIESLGNTGDSGDQALQALQAAIAKATT